MIKAIVIDDEPLARSMVLEYLQKHTNIEVVQECGDGFEGLKAIQLHQPQLIFLDIQMPKISGFELLELVDKKPAIIFTTAFDEFAIKAFETHAADYLLKPYTQERFDKALLKSLQNIGTEANHSINAIEKNYVVQADEKNRVVVKNGNNIKIIPATEIAYIEAYDDYVKIFTKDSYHVKKKTMNFFETVLNANEFLRVHRSYIVQLNQITRIEHYEKNSHLAILKTGAKVPLSRSGYTKLKEILGV